MILGLLLLVAVAPGTLVRSELPERVDLLTITSVGKLPATEESAGFRRVGVWELDSPNIDFGGYSALLLLDSQGTMRAFSDRGGLMTFGAPGSPRAGEVSFADQPERGRLGRYNPDVESAARDPRTGTYWLGFEGHHAIGRYSADGVSEGLREPPEWQAWLANSGAEAMARLADGRFLVLPEGGGEGLLHPGDPLQDEPAMRFPFTLPGDYAATDLAPLPDGRVLVLLRQVSRNWPPFSAELGIADPAGLAGGGTLEIESVLDLDLLLPRENYEGLAVEQAADGSLTIWIIADDNLASFQRTLLAQLVWTPPSARVAQAKARED